jgi:ankyrin repeat protein
VQIGKRPLRRAAAPSAVAVDPPILRSTSDKFANRRLWDAIRDNKRRFVVQAIEEDGANPNAGDEHGVGNTALHYAASYGRLRIVEYLLTRAGADVSVRNHAGETPLQVASRRDIREMLDVEMQRLRRGQEELLP